MTMYHKNRFPSFRYKRYLKRCTSRGMRRAAKKSCREEFTDRITLTRKSHNIHGIDAWLYS